MHALSLVRVAFLYEIGTTKNIPTDILHFKHKSTKEEINSHTWQHWNKIIKLINFVQEMVRHSVRFNLDEEIMNIK
jgi:hypothetical protein